MIMSFKATEGTTSVVYVWLLVVNFLLNSPVIILLNQPDTEGTTSVVYVSDVEFPGPFCNRSLLRLLFTRSRYVTVGFRRWVSWALLQQLQRLWTWPRPCLGHGRCGQCSAAFPASRFVLVARSGMFVYSFIFFAVQAGGLLRHSHISSVQSLLFTSIKSLL